MISKLKPEGNNQNKQFNQRYIKVNGEDTQEVIIIKVIIRRDLDQIVKIGELHSICRGQCGQNYRGRSKYINTFRNDFRRDNFRVTQNYRGQNYRGGYRGNYSNDNFRRGRGRSRERQYLGNFRRNNRNNSSRSRSGLRARSKRDRIRCFKSREYDHFAKHCLNSQTEKESEQIPQIYNLNEDQTALKVLVTDMYDNLIMTIQMIS